MELINKQGKLTREGAALVSLFLNSQGEASAALVARLAREYGAAQAEAFLDKAITLESLEAEGF